ncbi:GNAT family N-acetyltransferase [Pelagovum pacificum]|uniref:GNAT family N-acetyltransferase n=1 Tax=Pelagovum pacificum TaxID=2588711 RepID=A0A5C5GGM3_9RHOB|nr:GNAT family N-acetyltransferase [Pelagovum pacificum]QQA44889.1 GNAT family N-acetyltransferase [Pelagovum pacificum]TNY33364.1 GNAT family N-acetyltransferase [Pelagovum pacificum]
MTDLDVRPNHARDLAPLARLLFDEADLALVNPNAKHPFDPLEWQERWLNEADDESFYLVDPDGREVGFFALRVGVGPEIRHLTYVFVAEEARGGAGAQLAGLAEDAARGLGARAISLKVEIDNEPAYALYVSAGYEELSRSGDMATMQLELDPADAPPEPEPELPVLLQQPPPD